jgi:hypothetical protein
MDVSGVGCLLHVGKPEGTVWELLLAFVSSYFECGGVYIDVGVRWMHQGN